MLAYMIKEAEKFKALGEETRFRITRILIQAGKELCVCEIEDILNLPQYNISKHLNLLKRTELVIERRDGKLKMYGINENDSLNRSLFNSISSLKGSIDDRIKNDFNNLDKRLKLRENDQVVVTRKK